MEWSCSESLIGICGLGCFLQTYCIPSSTAIIWVVEWEVSSLQGTCGGPAWWCGEDPGLHLGERSIHKSYTLWTRGDPYSWRIYLGATRLVNIVLDDQVTPWSGHYLMFQGMSWSLNTPPVVTPFLSHHSTGMTWTWVSWSVRRNKKISSFPVFFRDSCWWVGRKKNYFPEKFFQGISKLIKYSGALSNLKASEYYTSNSSVWFVVEYPLIKHSSLISLKNVCKESIAWK